MNVSTFYQSTIYSTAGTYTLSVPSGSVVSFEMIAAGGNIINSSGLNTGGTGGYMAGSISLPGGVTSLNIVVGATGTVSGFTISPAGASYIKVSGAYLFAMVGAGGATNEFYAFQGAAGGGGTGAFTSGVAPGGDVCANSGGSRLSLTSGGLGTSDLLCTPNPAANGANAGTSGAYDAASGGSFTNYLGGGSGYAGGGAAADLGSGGGSSYYNTLYTTLTTSYGATTAIPANVLPGYGRSAQNGYVLVSIGTSISVRANGDFICRRLLYSGTVNPQFGANVATTSSLTTASTLSTTAVEFLNIMSSASGSILLGTGTPIYRFEINNGGELTSSIATGWRYTSAASTANAGSTISENIHMKTENGIWATIFYAASDERIKTDIHAIQDSRALEIVRTLKPVTYQYIDQVNRHNKIEYGFIAQDVRPILPHAIKQETDFIPNIYDLADFSTMTESTTLLQLRNKSTLDDIHTNDTIKLFDLRERPLLYRVLDKGLQNITVLGNLSSEVSEYELTQEDHDNKIQNNTVFIYGKKVDDLHVLNKQAIYSLGIAAMQEMDRVLYQQQCILNQQSAQMEELEQEFNKMDALLVAQQKE